MKKWPEKLLREIKNIEENASADNNIEMTPIQNEGPAF